MGSIDKYIFRTTLASFALVLVSLTGVIWITQALRGIDLMTSQGQTILTFLGITSLVIPALVLIISPIALMIAISHTLNKLATDSEIIVMNAAGFSPFRLFRPFLYATIVVAILVAFIAAYLAPDGMRRLKQWDAEITADVLTNILQPGRFAQLDQNLTIRIRERQPGGVLAGIFVDDRRDPKERVSIVADHGTVREERQRVVPDPRGRKSGAFRSRQARSRAGRVRPLRDSTCRNSPIRATTSPWGFANAISGNCLRRRPTIRSTCSCPDSSAPSCMTVSCRRSIRSRSRPSPSRFSARRARRVRAAIFRSAVRFSRCSGCAWRDLPAPCMAVKSPLAPAVQYLMLVAAIAAGLWIIVGGVVMEPPAALIEAINRSNARLLRLFGRPVTA